jgi:hypothetical protein
MAWTYGGDPAANARDAIRFLCGDTDTNDQLLNDAEIGWVNNQLTGSDTATTALYNAAYRCCLLVASKFSRLADQSVGDLKVSMSQKAKAYREQALQMLELAGREGSVPTPYAGGISIADKEVDWANTDVVKPGFYKGQFDDDRDGNTQQDLKPLWAGAE